MKVKEIKKTFFGRNITCEKRPIFLHISRTKQFQILIYLLSFPNSEAVDKVADRLLGPFNIEVLVRPINLKISEAIMNFQESSHDVSQRVFTGCGRPMLGRRRRRDNRELELESLNFEQETLTEDRSSTAAILDKLVKEIRQRVRDLKQFWIYLPYRLCNEGLVVPPSNTKECWNGTHVDKYA